MDTTAAVHACEDLLVRVLAAASMLLRGGESTPEPAYLIPLLGLDGARYLAFSVIARGARLTGAPTRREALECYAFATDARRALNRALRPHA
jgi:hypothetical protein